MKLNGLLFVLHQALKSNIFTNIVPVTQGDPLHTVSIAAPFSHRNNPNTLEANQTKMLQSV